MKLKAGPTMLILVFAAFAAGMSTGYAFLPPRVYVHEVKLPYYYNNTVVVNHTIPIFVNNTTVIYVPYPIYVNNTEVINNTLVLNNTLFVNNTLLVNNTVTRDNVTYVTGIPAREFSLVMNFTLLENTTIWIFDGNGIWYDIRLICYNTPPYNVTSVANATVILTVRWIDSETPPYVLANFTVTMGLNYSGGWWHSVSGGNDWVGFFDIASRVDMSQSAQPSQIVYFAVYFEYVYR